MIKIRWRTSVILIIGVLFITSSFYIFSQTHSDKISPKFYAYVTPRELVIHDNRSTIEVYGTVLSGTDEKVGEILLRKSILEKISFAGLIYPPRDGSKLVISEEWMFEGWYAIDKYEFYSPITLNGSKVAVIKANNYIPIDQNWISWQKNILLYPLFYLLLEFL